MTVKEIQDRLEDIRVKHDGDDEAQHSKEDNLWEDVLRAISKGAINPRELATAALKSKDLSFSRWCA